MLCTGSSLKQIHYLVVNCNNSVLNLFKINQTKADIGVIWHPSETSASWAKLNVNTMDILYSSSVNERNHTLTSLHKNLLMPPQHYLKGNTHTANKYKTPRITEYIIYYLYFDSKIN